ncbi:MAG: PorV/PorQ family protein [Elusimicrobia bacterium]|nr:PorV/PorQ family protein [Elusimicrobiota bacterium]
MTPYKKVILIFGALCSGIGAQARVGLAVEGAQFLKLKTSARLESLAGAGAAESQELSNLSINPATSSQLKSKELFFSQGFLFENVKFSFLSYCHPTKWGNANMDTFFLKYGEFDSTNEDREKIGTQSPKDFSIGFGWSANGKNFYLEELDLGFSLKTIHSDLGIKKANAFSLSLGAIYKTVFEGLNLGFAMNHFGSSLKYDREELALPRTLRFGLGFSGWELSTFSAKLKCFVDEVLERDGSAYSLLGTELTLLKLINFQIGYAGEEGFQNRFRYGFGIGSQDLQLNYAASPLGGLGTKHLISLKLRFSGKLGNLKTLFSRKIEKNIMQKADGDEQNSTILTQKRNLPDSTFHAFKSNTPDLSQENFDIRNGFDPQANLPFPNELAILQGRGTNKLKPTDSLLQQPKKIIRDDKTRIKSPSHSKGLADLRTEYDRALKCMNQRNLNEAIKLLRNIYVQEKTFEKVSKKLVSCLEARVVQYYANRQYDEAMKDILEGLKIDPFNERLKTFYRNTEEMLKTAEFSPKEMDSK